MGDDVNTIYTFGECRFSPKLAEITRNDEVTSLSGKAASLLTLLLEKNGDFVSKEEIFERIWPDTFVEDGVLTQNIYTLRKAIGSDTNGRPIIENEPRLGYRISVPIETNLPVIAVETAKPTSWLSSKWLGFAVGSVVFVLLITASIFVYQFIFPETVVSVSRLERIKVQKATDTADITFPTISPDGKYIAFIRNSSVFVKELSSAIETKVEISNLKRFGPMEFSKDGNSIYLRNRSSYFLPADIMKVSRFGGEAQKIAENVWSNGFSFSPDEKQVAFARSFPSENRHAVILRDLEAGSETELVSIGAPEEIRVRAFPTFSADGKRIAVIVDKQNQRFERIVIIDVSTKTSESISFKNLTHVEQIRWMPNKNTLLASAREGKFFQLWEISVAEQKLSRITNDLNNYLSLSLTADGKTILTTQNSFYTNVWQTEGANFEREKQLTIGNANRDGYSGMAALPNGDLIFTSNESESGAVDLFRLETNGGKRRQLTRNAGEFNRSPVVSPDGNVVYFESNRSGRSAIWQMSSNGDEPKQVTSQGKANYTFPQLSPDGSTLYFIRKSGKDSAVFRRSIADGVETQITESEKYSPANFLSLSPDGRYLGFQNITENIRSDDPKMVHQVIVLDTNDPTFVRTFNLGGRIPQIFWTSDSASFDYVIPLNEVDEIRRLGLAEGAVPQIVKSFAKERIYFISHLPQERTLVSRGRLENDAVLITNFE